MTDEIQWLAHDGGPNPVRPGETLTAVKLRGGLVSDYDWHGWRWSHDGNDDDITHYAVTPPRREPVDWSKPLVTNTGAGAKVCGENLANCARLVEGNFGESNNCHWFKPDGSHAYGEPIFVRNAHQWTVHPSAPPIAEQIRQRIAEIDAANPERCKLVKALEALV
jgi:hypothetical protein